jgi:hypothetical protein
VAVEHVRGDVGVPVPILEEKVRVGVLAGIWRAKTSWTSSGRPTSRFSATVASKKARAWRGDSNTSAGHLDLTKGQLPHAVPSPKWCSAIALVIHVPATSSDASMIQTSAGAWMPSPWNTSDAICNPSGYQAASAISSASVPRTVSSSTE